MTVILCLQVDGPITGGACKRWEGYKWQFTVIYYDNQIRCYEKNKCRNGFISIMQKFV